jgi:hypothetical protein
MWCIDSNHPAACWQNYGQQAFLMCTVTIQPCVAKIIGDRHFSCWQWPSSCVSAELQAIGFSYWTVTIKPHVGRIIGGRRFSCWQWPSSCVSTKLQVTAVSYWTVTIKPHVCRLQVTDVLTIPLQLLNMGVKNFQVQLVLSTDTCKSQESCQLQQLCIIIYN